MADFLIPEQNALVEDRHDEIWHVEFNDRKRNYLGPRDQVLITLARYPSLLDEVKRQRPVLRWLNPEIRFHKVSKDQLAIALHYLWTKQFLTASEANNLVVLLQCLKEFDRLVLKAAGL